jgi:release factor glutamine methyltransferase
LQRLEGIEAPRVLDVGTGSGCIALAIKHHCSGAVVHACDVSADALHLAQQNAATLELDVAFFEADLLSEGFADAVAGPYDAVVSNPPYVPDAEYNALAPEVRDHEPSTALRTGAAPLRYYRALAQRHAAIAAPGGLLAVEAHTDYASAVATCFAEHGLAGATVHRDLSGLARMVEARVPIR